MELIKSFDEYNLQKLSRIKNPFLHDFIAKYVELCNPSKIFVCTDNIEDENYVRKKALEYGEEKQLANPNHTTHFDNYNDQARDKENTRILVSGNVKPPYINTHNREKGLEEIHELMEGIMEGKEMFVCFFTLGPPNSPFEIPAIQLTDSAYVAHNEFLLFRKGYEVFKRLRDNPRFLKFVHSSGELDERKTSKNLDKRRIYIDLDEETVLSINTQYGGNSIGLKKLAFRLTIKRAVEEGWLSEHMFIMGVNGPNNRVSYFTGAFPSMCGKTSTCTLIHEKLVGDDIALIRNINGEARAANAEIGVFGIIGGVNRKDEPAIWEVLNGQNEAIFSNVLVKDGKAYWSGMGVEIPDEGENHCGRWWKGKKDEEGNEIPPSHKNARFTVRLEAFRNVDLEALNSPLGVRIHGIIFGGRDTDTFPPLSEAFDWVHGVITKGASLESETTAAILGKVGVRRFNPMAILDFLSVPLGKYIENYLEFGKKLKHKPRIFAVNYFLRDKNGRFLNGREDKAVWLKWMELRVNDEVSALKTPIGFIPQYDDLRMLFEGILDKNYSKDDYIKQFTIRVPELLAKIWRIEKIYKENVDYVPNILFDELKKEKNRLILAKERFGEYISPFKFSG